MKRNGFVIGFAAVLLAATLLAACASTGKYGGFYSGRDEGWVITGYWDTSTVVNIPEKIEGKPVVIIERFAFADKQLTKLTLPDGVQYIGNGAFANNQLTELTLPDSVEKIGNSDPLTTSQVENKSPDNVAGAFANNQLTKLAIPNGVKRIERGTFVNNQLAELILPDSIKWIERNAFANNRLTKLTIPNGVESIGIEAFANNRLTEITIPNSVRTIGSGAFANNQLTELTIPNGVIEIDRDTFANNRLTEITIPNSVRTISSGAFANNQLRTVTIPNTIASLSMDAFDGNSLVAPILIPESDKPIEVHSVKMSFIGEITGRDTSRIVTITRLGGNVIPDTVYGVPVTRITNSAHLSYSINGIRNGTRNFMEIENLTLPAGLTEISEDAFLGYYIQNVTFPNDQVRELWNRVYPATARANLVLMQEWELAKRQTQQQAEQAKQQKENKEFEKEIERLQGIRRAMEGTLRRLQ